jgi:hypothetical protein
LEPKRVSRSVGRGDVGFRYKYPDLQAHTIIQEIEKFRRNIWLEINSYLTALEQVNVVNKILFSYHN